MDTEWFEKWIKTFPPDEKMTSNDNVEAFTGKNYSYNQLSMSLLKILFFVIKIMMLRFKD